MNLNLQNLEYTNTEPLFMPSRTFHNVSRAPTRTTKEVLVIVAANQARYNATRGLNDPVAFGLMQVHANPSSLHVPHNDALRELEKKPNLLPRGLFSYVLLARIALVCLVLWSLIAYLKLLHDIKNWSESCLIRGPLWV
jgi:hypothetical protein